MDRIGKNNKEKNWEEVNMNNIAFYKRKNVLHFFLIYLNRTKMYAKQNVQNNASGVQNISKKSNLQNSPASSTDRKCILFIASNSIRTLNGSIGSF